MQSLLILRNIEVENANAIAGLTYGFPAISNFLGFTHALSRKLRASHNLTLGGCAVVCNQQQIHAYRPNAWGDYTFNLTRNPLGQDEKPAAFVEEGRMHAIVSLIIECDFTFNDFSESDIDFKENIKNLAITQRLAGGTVINIKKVEFLEIPESLDNLGKLTRKLMRELLPGFILVERSELLIENVRQLRKNSSNAEAIDAWLDFATLKFAAALPNVIEYDVSKEDIKTDWHYVAKPAGGWLVPITAGYRAISDLYQPGQVMNVRDQATPFRFVEPVYTVGEWLSPHRIKDLNKIFWRYQAMPDDGWYLCKNDYSPMAMSSNDSI